MTGFADDMQDAILDAQAEVMDAVREVVREVVLPMVEKNAKALWAQLPDEMKEQFKREKPQQYAALMKGMEHEAMAGRVRIRGAGVQRKGDTYGYK